MKRRTKRRFLLTFLPVLIGLVLPLTAEAQWTPFTAQYQERILRELPDGTDEVIAEFSGELSRSSSGSEWRTKVGMSNGQTVGKGHAKFKDAATGNIHHIDHDRRSVTRLRQKSLPFLPSPNFVPPESAALGTQVINGVRCVGKRVMVNGEFVPGAHWVSATLHLIVKEDITFPDGTRRVVEYSDFQYGEPSSSVFAIPQGYARNE